jgi:hypothetical protein
MKIMKACPKNRDAEPLHFYAAHIPVLRPAQASAHIFD